MKVYSYLCILLSLVFGVIIANQLDAEMHIDPTSLLKVRIYEQADADAKPEVHIDRSVVCQIDHPIHFIEARARRSQIDGDRWDVGTKISGYCSGVLRSPTEIDLKIELGELIRQEDRETTEVFANRVFHLHTELKRDEAKRIPLGKGVWCELTIQGNHTTRF
ncbi:hypothetical protein ACYFX5_06350 [Bremerella sp. T1]|uniref:hypothetical protein n=1 Tax=Bremerella sp. TYQ1 TaxID=3119568 RepID=UPI001CCFD508|nr:hypothetical protein [Bremerella volcania]UBM37878.1 hypothetical protein LA756_08295 [Bremerella volcania]